MRINSIFDNDKSQSSAKVFIFVLFVLSIFSYMHDFLVSQFIAPLSYALIGFVFLKVYFREGGATKPVQMFSVIFCIYTLYTILFYHFYQFDNLNYMLNNNYNNIWDDQVRNFLIADFLSGFSLREIHSITFSYFGYSELPLFAFLLGILGKAMSLLDSCNYLSLVLHVTLISALIPVFLYKISLHYFDEKLSYKIAMIYAIFSFPLFFAARLLRDQHIAFIYIWAIYLICKPERSLGKFIQVIVLAVICYFFRVEHGYFMILLVGIYLQLWLKKFLRDTRIVMLTMGTITFSTLIFLEPEQTGVGEVLDVAETSYSRYEERSIDKAGKDSFGKELMKLPVPLNYVTTGAFGQIQPFPLWVNLGFSNNRTNWSWFPEAIAGVFWFLVWGVLLRGIFTGKLAMRKLPDELLLLSISSVLLILLTTAEINTRRMYCMYPPLYLLGVFSYLKMSVNERRGLVSLLVIIFITLHVAYSIMKIMQGGSPI